MSELLDDIAAASSLFGNSFGLPFTNSLGNLQTRQMSWPEMMPAYRPLLAQLSPAVLPTAALIADLRRFVMSPCCRSSSTLLLPLLPLLTSPDAL
jgi:hypothetical protein